MQYDTESSRGQSSPRSFASIRREVFLRRAEEVEQRLDSGMVVGNAGHHATPSSSVTSCLGTLMGSDHSSSSPCSSVEQGVPGRLSEVVAMQRFLAQRRSGRHTQHEGAAVAALSPPAAVGCMEGSILDGFSPSSKSGISSDGVSFSSSGSISSPGSPSRVSSPPSTIYRLLGSFSPQMSSGHRGWHQCVSWRRLLSARLGAMLLVCRLAR